MIDPIFIEGIHPAILALIPFVIVLATLAVRAGFKEAGKPVPALTSQVIAFVISLGAVIGTLVLYENPMPVDFIGWSQLVVGVFSVQMTTYEVIVKRVIEWLEKKYGI